jgi:hypothetical protein
MLLHANGNVSMTTSNTTLFIGNTAISNAGISVGGAAINPLATGMRNRIINGDMKIFQRGNAATISDAFSVDRWKYVKSHDGAESVTQSTDAPPGLSYSIKSTVGTADTSIGAAQFSLIRQHIEGYNIADFAWGTANAKPVTLSFWVKSSLTGTHCGAIHNAYTEDRICPYKYTVNAANTWEYKTITFPGHTDAGGTAWNTTNGPGLILNFYMALGSNFVNGTDLTWGTAPNYGSITPVNILGTVGNTFAVSGVQLEVGSVASPFENRSFGLELLLCQRYYEKSFPQGTAPADAAGQAGCITAEQWATGHNYLRFSCVTFATEKRASPTITFYNPNVVSASYKAGYEDNTKTANNAAIGDRTAFRSTRSFYPLLNGSVQTVNLQFDCWCTQWTAECEL